MRRRGDGDGRVVPGGPDVHVDFLLDPRLVGIGGLEVVDPIPVNAEMVLDQDAGIPESRRVDTRRVVDGLERDSGEDHARDSLQVVGKTRCEASVPTIAPW